MTERVLPAIQVPLRGRSGLAEPIGARRSVAMGHPAVSAHPGVAPRPAVLPRPARPAVEPRPVARPGVARPAAGVRAAHRREGFLTTPARAGMLLGGAAAVYAVTLAGVAALQSSSDAALAASRQPWLDRVAAARAANDDLEQAVQRADADARWLGGLYDDVGGAVAGYQARLDALAALVAEVEGSAAALPTRIALPKVSVRSSGGVSRSGGTSKAPSSTSTSGASGG